MYACVASGGVLWWVVVCVYVVAAGQGEVVPLKKVRSVLWQMTIIL